MVMTTQSYPAFSRLNGRSTDLIARRPVATVQKVADSLHTKPLGLSNVLNFLAIGAASDKVSGHFASDFGQAVSVFSACAKSALGNLVCRIVGRSPKPQVIGVHASWGVAPVQDVKASKVSDVEKVGEAVRQNRTFGPAAPKTAVPGLVNGRSPKPAPRHGVMVNVRHKAIYSGHRITVSTQMAFVK